MKVYSIFDDFNDTAIQIFSNAGIEIVIHPQGLPRPNEEEMKILLEEYDCVIIGTSQKITEEMFGNINTPKIIATASVGVDHISVPIEKKSIVEVINTPRANGKSVAEYTIAMALSCCKRIEEGIDLYRNGKDNKQLCKKPEDLSGKVIGVIGAGYISTTIMQYAAMMGMRVFFWTKHPEKHMDLLDSGFCYVELQELITVSDVISVNLPNIKQTKGFVSKSMIEAMKDDCMLISVSRLDTIDIDAIIEKAVKSHSFYACIDIDVNTSVVEKIKEVPNVFVTPHIAGGTKETRKRMFIELAERIVERRKNDYK